MPVFKLITQSTRSVDGFEVTRWTVNDSVHKVTWERLTERIQRLLKTRSTGFYLSWFDGLDYCTVRDYLELQDAAQIMMAEGDGSIRLYVSREKREPSTVFGEKPCIEERPTVKPTPIPEDKNNEKPTEEPRAEKPVKPKSDKKDKKPKKSEDSDSSSSDSDTEETQFVPAPEVKPKPEPKEKPQPEQKPAADEKPKSEGQPEPKPETKTEAVPMPIPAPGPQPGQAYPHTTPVPPTQVPVFVPTPNGMPVVQPIPYANYPPYYVATPTPPVVSYGFAPWLSAVPQPAQPVAATSEQNKPESSECEKPKKQSADVMTEFNQKEDQRMLITLKRLSSAPETKYDPFGKQKYKILSLQALRAMGFRQDECYLKMLIKKTNGNINKIIDVLEAKHLFSERLS